MKILIAGASGQLAGAFIRQISMNGNTMILPPERDFDITKAETVRRIVHESKPNIILNCAAYNQVDKAETDEATAMRVNADGPENLAKAAAEIDAFFVHYGSDYVFDGTKEGLNTETDPTAPLNIYGKSKLEGEQRVLASGGKVLVMRLSWVFGAGPQNFLYKLSEWASKNRVLRVVYDQISVPSYTEDIAEVTLKAIDRRLEGLYHCVNSGYATRYEVAKYFLEKIRMENVLLPVASEFFPVPAKRPYFSAMSNAKLVEALGHPIPSWQNAIDRYVKAQYPKLEV